MIAIIDYDAEISKVLKKHSIILEKKQSSQEITMRS